MCDKIEKPVVYEIDEKILRNFSSFRKEKEAVGRDFLYDLLMDMPTFMGKENLIEEISKGSNFFSIYSLLFYNGCSHKYFIIHDNILYSSDGKEFFQLITKLADSNVGVICSCGCTSFSLKYGEYEINATCTNCGKSDTVYSG